MGVIKEREGSGGAEIEVVQPVTLNQLIKLGELPSDCSVYEVETKQKIDGNTIMQPGRAYGNTVQAQYGS